MSRWLLGDLLSAAGVVNPFAALPHSHLCYGLVGVEGVPVCLEHSVELDLRNVRVFFKCSRRCTC